METKNHYNPTRNRHWKKLIELAKSSSLDTIHSNFLKDAKRVSKYSIALEKLYVDFSKHLITDEIRVELNSLAATSALLERRDAMFKGEPINLSENRSVLHVALRNPNFHNKTISSLIIRPRSLFRGIIIF